MDMTAYNALQTAKKVYDQRVAAAHAAEELIGKGAAQQKIAEAEEAWKKAQCKYFDQAVSVEGATGEEVRRCSACAPQKSGKQSIASDSPLLFPLACAGRCEQLH